MRGGGKTLVTQLSGVGQRRSALVCDSEPQSLRTLKATLRGSGLVMWPTASAEEALTVAALRAPDAAIIDMDLVDSSAAGRSD